MSEYHPMKKSESDVNFYRLSGEPSHKMVFRRHHLSSIVISFCTISHPSLMVFTAKYQGYHGAPSWQTTPVLGIRGLRIKRHLNRLHMCELVINDAYLDDACKYRIHVSVLMCMKEALWCRKYVDSANAMKALDKVYIGNTDEEEGELSDRSTTGPSIAST